MPLTAGQSRGMDRGYPRPSGIGMSCCRSSEYVSKTLCAASHFSSLMICQTAKLESLTPRGVKLDMHTSV